MGFAFLVRAGDDSPPVSERQGKRHKMVGMWAHQAISLVHRWLPDRDIKLMGETAYSVLEPGLHAKAQQVALITTGRLDAVLHEPPPERTQYTIGRRRVKGLRLPTLEQVLQNPATAWQKLTVNWHGKARANPGNVHQHGPVVPLWIQSLTHRASVLTRDPLGKRPPKAIFSTDHSLTAKDLEIKDMEKQEKEAELKQVDQKVALTLEREQLTVEQQRLEVMSIRLDVEKKRVQYTLELAAQLIDTV